MFYDIIWAKSILYVENLLIRRLKFGICLYFYHILLYFLNVLLLFISKLRQVKTTTSASGGREVLVVQFGGWGNIASNGFV